MFGRIFIAGNIAGLVFMPAGRHLRQAGNDPAPENQQPQYTILFSPMFAQIVAQTSFRDQKNDKNGCQNKDAQTPSGMHR